MRVTSSLNGTDTEQKAVTGYNPEKPWQVLVNGEIYHADFDELAQWINEGAVLPTDKIRRGNLRWLEAAKIPALYGLFNALELGISPPVEAMPPPAESTKEWDRAQKANAIVQQAETSENVQSGARAVSTEASAPPVQWEPQSGDTDRIQNAPENTASSPMQGNLSEFCSIHPETASAFACDACGNSFCKRCPTSYGVSVKICPFCGGLCRPFDQAAKNQQSYGGAYNPGSAGVLGSSHWSVRQKIWDERGKFGFSDFGAAMSYPFRFKTSLIVGAIMFMFFTLGQTASNFGGIIMMAASLFCVMCANMLTFGVLANTVENMSQGIIDKNFMPNFDDFNLWDDVIHPFFLSIAAYLVSFGLFFAIVLAGIYFAVKSASSELTDGKNGFTFEQQSSGNAARQMEQFRKLNEQMRAKNAESLQRFEEDEGELLSDQNGAASNLRSHDTEESVREAQQLIDQTRKSQIESVIGKSPETQEAEKRDLIGRLFKYGIPLILLACVALLWGVFYFPAACAVAGYTRNFAAVINPMVGLDTIKRLGTDYFKILGMCIVILIMSAVVGMVLRMIFAAFDMPGVGNIPAKAIESLFAFYFSVVFAVVLGFALYKNAEKFSFYRS